MNYLQLRNHNNYYNILLTLLLVGMTMPFTATQAIDVTVESRATTGIMIYQFREDYSRSDDVNWQDSFPFWGVGGTISLPLNLCERLFFDVYAQQSDVGNDHKFYSVSSSGETILYDRDDNVDFSRRDLAGTVGCTIPNKIFFDGAVTLTAGYKGGQTEINGTHRVYLSNGITIMPEDSTTLKTDGLFGGVSLVWPLAATWQFQINLAYGRFQSKYGSDYRGNVEGTITGATGGIKLQNTLTRHLTWSISADYFNYDMTVNLKSPWDSVERIGEQVIPFRASLIWRF